MGVEVFEPISEEPRTAFFADTGRERTVVTHVLNVHESPNDRNAPHPTMAMVRPGSYTLARNEVVRAIDNGD